MTEYMRVDTGGGRQELRPVVYPSNSAKAREEAKKKFSHSDKPDNPGKPEKVVTGTVVRKKKGFGHYFAEAFTGGSGAEGLLETLITDILASALKGMISDAVSQGTDAVRLGFDRLLYGDASPRTRPVRTGYVNYSGVSRNRTPSYGTIGPRARASHDFSDVIMQNRAEAEVVLDELRSYIENYGMVSVADFYNLVGITGEFTDEDWGWVDLQSALVRPVRGGYMIRLPRTINIRNQ